MLHPIVSKQGFGTYTRAVSNMSIQHIMRSCVVLFTVHPVVFTHNCNAAVKPSGCAGRFVDFGLDRIVYGADWRDKE